MKKLIIATSLLAMTLPVNAATTTIHCWVDTNGIERCDSAPPTRIFGGARQEYVNKLKEQRLSKEYMEKIEAEREEKLLKQTGASNKPGISHTGDIGDNIGSVLGGPEPKKSDNFFLRILQDLGLFY